MENNLESLCMRCGRKSRVVDMRQCPFCTAPEGGSVPSQPSMEEIISNPANIEKAAKKSNEMQRETVRDEKIARIVKEFREKFDNGMIIEDGTNPAYIDLDGRLCSYDTIESEIEAWLTQTLTTLLNEE